MRFLSKSANRSIVENIHPTRRATLTASAAQTKGHAYVVRIVVRLINPEIDIQDITASSATAAEAHGVDPVRKITVCINSRTAEVLHQHIRADATRATRGSDGKRKHTCGCGFDEGPRVNARGIAAAATDGLRQDSN